MKVLLALALLVAAVVAGCGGSAEVSSSQRPAEEASSRTGDASVTVELPPGWHAGTPADGNVIDPLTRVVASSAPVRLRAVPCQIARYAPPASDVTLVVVEWERSADARPGERPSSFTRETLPLYPPPAIECFDGPGGSVQFVDHDRLFGAYLLIGKQAPVGLVEEALAVLNTLQVKSPAPAGRRLTRNGASIAVPAGWDGRILFRDPTGSRGVIFQVANFRLPDNEGFEPPRELPPGQEDPIKAMDDGDVLITVNSDEASGDPVPETVTLDRLRFLPAAAPRVPRGHRIAEGAFCYAERCVRIVVDFGGRSEAPLRSAVNAVLGSLAVKRGVEADPNRQDNAASVDDPGPRGCPRKNWPGPWTACAEADWVHRVVAESGYQVVGETGSALVAQGKGRSFYIWTTPAVRNPAATAADAGNWRRLATIDAVAIYGDDDLWRFWEAQSFIFWVKEGPSGASIVPSPAELESLVEASRTTPPPQQ
jgi:hypothetical protein